MRTSELAARLPEAMLRQFNRSAAWEDAVSQGIAWEHAAGDPDCIRAASAKLSGEARAALASAVRHYGAGPFEEELLAAAAGRELRAADVRRGLTELRRAGIVFAVRKPWGDRQYFLPTNAYAAWLHALHPASLQRAEADGKRTVRLDGGYRSPLSLQLLHALASLAQAGMRLTNRGILPKRAAAAMTRRFECRAEELEGLRAAAEGYGHEDRALVVMLDALMGLGLVAREPEGGRLGLDAHRIAAWLSCPAAIRESSLYAWMFERYAAHEPLYRHAAAALAMLPCGIWHGTGQLDDWLRQLGAEGEGRWRGWTDALCGFGWLQRGRMPDGSEALRWTMEPNAAWTARPLRQEDAAAGLLRFLPGGDIVAPPDLDYRIRWELELLAASVSPGPMAVYRCSAATVARFMRHRRTAEEAIRLLSEGAGSPVPDDLARLLEGWAEQADASEDGEERCWPSGKLATERCGVPEPLSSSGLVQPAYAPQLDALDEELPDLEPAVRKALGRMPSAWLKQLREYHPTTRREMLKQAIALGVSVRIERGGRTVDFTPIGIEEGPGCWKVRGTLRGDAGNEETCLSPDMWAGMQLHVPEFGFEQRP